MPFYRVIFCVPVLMCDMAQTPILDEKSWLINVNSLLKSVSWVCGDFTMLIPYTMVSDSL